MLGKREGWEAKEAGGEGGGRRWEVGGGGRRCELGPQGIWSQRIPSTLCRGLRRTGRCMLGRRNSRGAAAARAAAKAVEKEVAARAVVVTGVAMVVVREVVVMEAAMVGAWGVARVPEAEVVG